MFENSQALDMHGIREQEGHEDVDENDIEAPCKRMSLHSF